MGELAADLGDRVRQFVGRDRRRFHVGGSFVESLHGAFGALRGLIGGAEQRGGCRTHGGRAVAHAGQKFLHLRAERGDGRVDDRAPLLLVADGGAFGLGVTLLGDVLMGRDPAAVRQRLIFGEHDAAVARLHVMLRAFALADAVEDFLAIGGDVAGEQPGVFAMLDQCVQRAARLHDVGRELVHFEVAPVEQGDAALRIEHVQPLRHVVRAPSTAGGFARAAGDAGRCSASTRRCTPATRCQRQSERGHRGPAPKKMIWRYWPGAIAI